MRCSFTLVLILLFVSYPEANLTEKQKAAITVTISVGAAVGIVLLVKKLATLTCQCSETDSVKIVRFCKTCLYNWPTNPIPKCAKFTKDQKNNCVVAPDYGCECYEGQTKIQSGMTCTCVAAADGSSCHWECGECIPGNVECTGPSTHRTCQNNKLWGASENCPTNQICSQGGLCTNQPCPEGSQECSENGSGYHVCQNGMWQPNIPCPIGCLNGYCRKCPTDGGTQCDENGVRQVCQNGQWTDNPCPPGYICRNGNCQKSCDGNTIWCEKYNKCVPKCNPYKCEVLSTDGSHCESLCRQGWICSGSYTCSNGYSNQNYSVSDPCPASSYPPILYRIELFTHTNDDDKDHNTGIYLDVKTNGGKLIAQCQNADCSDDNSTHYNDNSDHVVRLKIISQEEKESCNGFSVHMWQRTHGGLGHDTWKFNATVKMTFSDGQILQVFRNSIKLVNDNASVDF